MEGRVDACLSLKGLDMARATDVILFLKNHDWEFTLSFGPFGEGGTRLMRFRCSRCRAEYGLFSTDAPRRPRAGYGGEEPAGRTSPRGIPP